MDESTENTADDCISLTDVGPICYFAKAAHFTAFSLCATSVNKAAVLACMCTMWPGCWDFHLAGTMPKDWGCLLKNKRFIRQRVLFIQASLAEYRWMSVYRKCGNQTAEQRLRRRAFHSLVCDCGRTMQGYPFLHFCSGSAGELSPAIDGKRSGISTSNWEMKSSRRLAAITSIPQVFCGALYSRYVTLWTQNSTFWLCSSCRIIDLFIF